MTSKDFIAVDDAQIPGLISYDNKTRQIESRRTWIDFPKLELAIQFRLARFYMHEVYYEATYYDTKCFIRNTQNFVPCGWFSYDNIG